MIKKYFLIFEFSFIFKISFSIILQQQMILTLAIPVSCSYLWSSAARISTESLHKAAVL